MASTPDRLSGAGPSCAHGRQSGSCAECTVRLISVCGALSLDELTALERLNQPLVLPPRATLFGQDDRATAVYNVTKGALRLSRLLPDGRRHVLGFVFSGDFLGLALDDHFTMSAEALTHVQACRFDLKAFRSLTGAMPSLLGALHARTSHELSLAQDHMLLLGRRTAEERVASFLLGLRERYRRNGLTSATLELPMTRQDIADHLGLTIETVSRTFARFTRERLLLDVPSGVRVLAADRLERLAGC